MNEIESIFGTDGIRGKTNEYPMTADVAMKLAAILGNKIIKKSDPHSLKRVIIGKDTRKSCYLFEAAMESGFAASGIDVILTGPIPTPAVSILTKSLRADMGIMISASHNQFEDNGIKIFDRHGLKLSDTKQNELDGLVRHSNISDFFCKSGETGRVSRLDDAVGRYIESIKSSFPSDLSLTGLKIALDVANGAAYRIAPEIFRELGAEVFVFNNYPNGENINKDCGSTYPDFISRKTVEHGCDIGLSLDGDADRIIICDELGNIIDGDYIIAAIVTHYQNLNKLKGNKVITTIMSNMGFEGYIKSRNLELIRTNVGDRNVLYKMMEVGANVGGEQSGHIILSDHSCTGDGILSALQLLAFRAYNKLKTSDIGKLFVRYPQIMRNIKHPDQTKLANLEIQKFESELGRDGRILIRKSGTENVLRIMIEGINSEVNHSVMEAILKSLS